MRSCGTQPSTADGRGRDLAGAMTHTAPAAAVLTASTPPCTQQTLCQSQSGGHVPGAARRMRLRRTRDALVGQSLAHQCSSASPDPPNIGAPTRAKDVGWRQPPNSHRRVLPGAARCHGPGRFTGGLVAGQPLHRWRPGAALYGPQSISSGVRHHRPILIPADENQSRRARDDNVLLLIFQIQPP